MTNKSTLNNTEFDINNPYIEAPWNVIEAYFKNYQKRFLIE
jgi:hypothetical protein